VTNLASLLKQAQAMQAKMAEMQEGLARIEVEGQAGAGLIKAVLTGKGELRSIKIDPSLANPAELEVLVDLLVAAHNDAKGKLDLRLKEEMAKVTGGLELPAGMKLPF
jgi:nucleoid-associated protein EbfC